MITRLMAQDLPRVGFFLPDLAGGGAERMILALANGFGAAGLSTDLILMSALGDYLGEVSPDVRLVDLGSRRASRSVAALRRHILAARLDVLISALDHANVCAAAAVALSGRQRPRLYLSQRNNFSQTARTKSTLLTWAVRRALRRADGVLAVSEGVRQDLIDNHGLPADQVVTTYNPVVSQAMINKSFEMSLPIPSLGSRPYLLACGRLEHQKGFDVLIESFARIAPSHPDTDLVILGQGSLMTALHEQAAKAKIAGRVHLPGFVRNPFAMMRKAEAFVMSSRFEGLPGVLIQAMACGAAVVSTDCESGPREVLEDGRYGALVPVDDPAALAQALDAVLRQPCHDGVVARAAIFGVNQVVKRHIDLTGLAGN